jgi:hypothetical protein
MNKRDIPAYLVGAALVALMIWLDLRLDDAGVTFILVSLFPMVLAIWRSDRPWRWLIFFSLPLIVESFLAAYPLHMVRDKNPAYSIVAIVPAGMGAYLGALCRRAVDLLWQKKE